MTEKILWRANKSKKNVSNLFRYEKFLFLRYKYKITQKYPKLHKWTVNNPEKFWSSIWDFTKVKGLKVNKNKKSKTKQKS